MAAPRGRVKYDSIANNGFGFMYGETLAIVGTLTAAQTALDGFLIPMSACPCQMAQNRLPCAGSLAEVQIYQRTAAVGASGTETYLLVKIDKNGNSLGVVATILHPAGTRLAQYDLRNFSGIKGIPLQVGEGIRVDTGTIGTYTTPPSQIAVRLFLETFGMES